MKKILFFLFLLALSLPAFSQEDPAKEAFHQWELSLVRVSFTASIGVEIPWIANVSLQPQVEFIWR